MLAGCRRARRRHGGPVEFTPEGKLKKPVGYRKWVYVGTPLTPNELNGGEAPFPEFHAVYIDPESFAHYEKTGEFRDGTVMIKELVGIGAKEATSGKGYFMGDFIGLEASIKDSKRFKDEPGNWAYFSFGHHYPLKAEAATERRRLVQLVPPGQRREGLRLQPVLPRSACCGPAFQVRSTSPARPVGSSGSRPSSPKLRRHSHDHQDPPPADRGLSGSDGARRGDDRARRVESAATGRSARLARPTTSRPTSRRTAASRGRPITARPSSYLGTYAVATKPDQPVDEMHVVYSRPEDVRAYRRDGKFPDGAALVKEVTTGRLGEAHHGAIQLGHGHQALVRDDQGREGAIPRQRPLGRRLGLGPVHGQGAREERRDRLHDRLQDVPHSGQEGRLDLRPRIPRASWSGSFPN